jgi:AraC family transcriptional activator of tynA and feaB
LTIEAQSVSIPADRNSDEGRNLVGSAFSTSTRDVAPGERIAFWNAGSSRIGGVRAEALCDRFDAEVSHRTLGGLCVYRLVSDPHRVTTMPLGKAQGRSVRLRYQQSGSSVIMKGGRSFRIEQGDWIISDPHEAYMAVNERQAAHLWLQVPCAGLSARQLRTLGNNETRIRIDGRTSDALREAMVHTLDSRTTIQEPDMVGRLMAWVRRALGEGHGDILPGFSRAETASRARAIIARNLRDPELSVERVAQELGCTARYLHKVFEGSDSVCRTIWNMRLDQCRAQLAQPGTELPTLTALAFDFGFNSSSHFSRSFRDRFGMTPSAFVAATQS